MTDEWWKSKTKRGGLLVGLGTIVTTIGLVDSGQLDIFIGLAMIVAEVGTIMTIFGYRNALDKKK